MVSFGTSTDHGNDNAIFDDNLMQVLFLDIDSDGNIWLNEFFQQNFELPRDSTAHFLCKQVVSLYAL